MKFKRPELNQGGINLTPMIDMVFLLVLFFAVSANFNQGSQVALVLPTAQGQPPVKEQQVVITISADGRYHINGSTLSRSDAATLKTVLRPLAADTKDKPLIINADAQASHQSVVTVMDVAGQLGFVQVSMSTIKPEGGS